MRRFIFVLVVIVGLVPRAALAQAVLEKDKPAQADVAGSDDDALYSCKHRTGSVAVTLKPDTEVKDLLAWVMGFTCKNFVLDPRVVATGRKVTIIAPNKLTPSEAYRMFLVALSTINLAVVDKGGIVRIIDAPLVKKQALPILKKGMPDDTDLVVRYLYKPSYVQPELINQGCSAIKSDAGDVMVVGSFVVITDYASHVREMISFAKLVDVPGGSDAIYTIPVKHADAAKLAEKINGILNLQLAAAGSKPPAGPELANRDVAAVPSKILVDERTNTLLVAASDLAYERVKALVERLDIELDIEGGNAIHVYPLGSAIADELAKTLTAAISTDNRGPTKPATGAPAGPPLPPSPADGLGASLEGQVRVIADSKSNALIVMSSGRDFFAIKDVIRQLDQPRRQVYIEAMILEVDITNGVDLGTVSHGALPLGKSGSTLLGGVEAADTKSFGGLDTVANLSGLVGGLIGQSTTLLGKTIPSYAVLFQALSNQTNVNILSNPSVIAVDNELAKYKIGTAIPYRTGVTFNGLATGGTQAPGAATSNIDHKELPLILEIKPHISVDDTVLLEVNHSAMDLVSNDKDLGPTWSTRSIETRVVVRDQQTVVIGGLMQEREDLSSTKVPLLGDIPLLGYLFKSTSKSKRKTNLLVMLTPYIIKDQLDLQAILSRKQRDHDEFVRSFSTLESMKFQPKIDYGRKRGLVEEINRTIQSVEEDVAARGKLEKPRGVPPGMVVSQPTVP